MVSGFDPPVAHIFPVSPVVRMFDFHSKDPGSIPGRGGGLAIAQLEERWTVNPSVVGSIPTREKNPIGAMDSAPDF